MNITLTGTKIVQDNKFLAFEKNSNVDVINITVDTDESWSYKLDVKYPDKCCSGEPLYNIIDLTRTSNICTAVLTSDMLPFAGKYTMQLRAISGEKVKHSDTFDAWVKYSIEPRATYDPVPSEFYQIEENITEMNNHPPYPGSNGYWMIWDVATHSYKKSDIKAADGLPEISESTKDMALYNDGEKAEWRRAAYTDVYYWNTGDRNNDLFAARATGSYCCIVRGTSPVGVPCNVMFGAVDRGYVNLTIIAPDGGIYSATMNLMNTTISDPIKMSSPSLCVTITQNDDGTYSSDHTYAEIKAAYDAGKYVYAVLNSQIVLLEYIDSAVAEFMFSVLPLVSDGYLDIGGLLRISIEIRITSDGIVSVDTPENSIYAIPQQFVVHVIQSDNGTYTASMTGGEIVNAISVFGDVSEGYGIADFVAEMGGDLYRFTSADLKNRAFIFVCEGEITKILTCTAGVGGDTWSYKEVGRDLIIPSSTAGSTKKFKISVDDSGAISATEVTN